MAVGGEVFRAKGTVVKERNTLPPLRVGEKVKVAALSVEQGTTTVGALRWGEG